MKHIFVIFLLLVFIVPAQASTDIDTLGDFMQEVRWILDYKSNDLLPDSALIGLAKRAITWTSIDFGGVEATFLIVTDTLQRFYAFPDTVTEILFATLVNENVTHSIKAFIPAYYEDIFNQTILQPGTEDQIPQAYNLWADTIQFIPTPIKVDSVYFKCYIEHSAVTAKADDILLRPGFIEAAIQYCCYLVYQRWKIYDAAAVHLQAYEALGVKLTNRYKKPMEMLAQ